MYWIDKYLLLRFYRIPKNFDETNIEYTVQMMKYAFIWHFFLGFFALSNNSILAPDGSTEVTASFISDASEKWLGQQLFSSERYQTTHIQLYLLINLTILGILFIDATILDFFTSKARELCACCPCCNANQPELVSSDYYDLLELRFIISEYKRAKLEILNYQKMIRENRSN